MVTTVLAPDHPNPTQYPTPPITSNRVQPLLVRRRLLLRALPNRREGAREVRRRGGAVRHALEVLGARVEVVLGSLNDSSSSSDSSSPPPPAAGASPSFLPPLGGVLGENDPAPSSIPTSPSSAPTTHPTSSTDADARRDLRQQAQR